MTYRLKSTTGAILTWETLKYRARSINPVPVRMNKKEYETFKRMENEQLAALGTKEGIFERF